MSSKQQLACSHPTLSYSTSPHAAQVEYKQPTRQERVAATKPRPSSKLPIPSTRSDIENFPAPLVLPRDDLAVEPDPTQDFQKWYSVRNPLTSRRRTIYVASPPVYKELNIDHWTTPLEAGTKTRLSSPGLQDVKEYLEAFYHGLRVKELEFPNWGFAPWIGDRLRGKNRFIGLNTQKQCVRIRARPSPDGIYPYQLNLKDVLDAAIAMLPSDAYALCLLVDHDLFEDDDDIFVCGRAYGGRRVAVVSTARYNPILDNVQSVEQDHIWPASHCQQFIERTCHEYGSITKRSKKAPSKGRPNPKAPLEAALAAISTMPNNNMSSSLLSTLWLARIVRTVSHELGHCFGIGHCAYYACIMQGSASLSEDMRQPPYLCPVDLAKLISSTQGTIEPRYRALLAYCERPGIRDLPYFAAYAGWLRASLELEQE